MNTLQKENGSAIITQTKIDGEILSFYASLVGSATTSIKGIGIEAMRHGKQVSPDQCAHLIRYVSKDETFVALKGINDNYAPGVDG